MRVKLLVSKSLWIQKLRPVILLGKVPFCYVIQVCDITSFLILFLWIDKYKPNTANTYGL